MLPFQTAHNLLQYINLDLFIEPKGNSNESINDMSHFKHHTVSFIHMFTVYITL